MFDELKLRKMDKDKELERIIEKLSSPSDKWLQIRAVLLEEISNNQYIIELIDKRVKDNEIRISKLQWKQNFLSGQYISQQK